LTSAVSLIWINGPASEEQTVPMPPRRGVAGFSFLILSSGDDGVHNGMNA
jgi:hypothetical protein